MVQSVSAILERITAAGLAFGDNEIGSRESLIELSRDLIATLEIPSEFLQRSFWAEVSEINGTNKIVLCTNCARSRHYQHTASLPFKSSCFST